METLILISLFVLLLPYFWLLLFFLPPIDTIFCVSMWKIFERMNYSQTATLVPFYNFRIFLYSLNLPSKYLFLLFIPLLNWFIIIKVFLRISYIFNRNKYFAVGLFILPWIFFPILAYSNKPSKDFNTDFCANSYEIGLTLGVFFSSILTLFLFYFIVSYSINKEGWIFIASAFVIWLLAWFIDFINIYMLATEVRKSYSLRLFKVYLPAIIYIFYFIPSFFILIETTWWSNQSIWTKLFGTLLYIISIIRLGHLINIIKITYLSKLAYRKGEKQISYRGTEIDVEQYTLN